MKSRVPLVFLGLIAAIAVSAAQAPTAVRNEQVEALARRYLADANVAGLSIALARGESLVGHGGWGLADRTGNVPATTATVYRLASVSKQFTAALIMRLVERGKVKLDDAAEVHVPDMPRKWHGVTVRQLLNHTAGVPDFDTTGPGQWPKKLPPMGILGLVADRGLLFKPGSRYEYSNSNYMLLGLIAEKHYAKPLANIIADEIGVPLGLASLKLCDDEYGANGQAKPYVRDGEKIIDAPYRSMSHSFGAGGICSDVSDVWKWNRALHLGKVVSAESYKMMITPEGAAKAGAEPYGFGLIPRAVAGRPALTHGGTIPGFINVNVWIPSDEISVTIALNTSSTPETPALLRDLARIALGQPVRIAEPSAGPPPDAKALRAYEGTYTIQVPGRPLDIRFWVDGGVLMSQAEGQNEAPMRLVGEHAFGTKRDWTVEFAFVLENGRATGFTFHQAGLTFQGVRKR